MKKWIAVTVFLAALVGCGMVGGPVSGVVLDAETKKPIEGAYVVAQWSGSSSVSIAESQTVCIYTDMAKTDEKGRFFSCPDVVFREAGGFTGPALHCDLQGGIRGGLAER